MRDNPGTESMNKHKNGKPNPIPQLLCAIALSFGSTITGGWMSFSSVAIPKMMKNDSTDLAEEVEDIQIDLHTGSWIASLFFFATLLVV